MRTQCLGFLEGLNEPASLVLGRSRSTGRGAALLGLEASSEEDAFDAPEAESDPHIAAGIRGLRGQIAFRADCWNSNGGGRPC